MSTEHFSLAIGSFEEAVLAIVSNHPRATFFFKLVCSLALLSSWSILANQGAAQTRSLGIDISAWQGNLSQATWNSFAGAGNRDFVLIRSSRGGTTGYYNQSNSDNDPPTNTFSQRYDDPYFVQNITRATNAGMLAGCLSLRPNGYHRIDAQCKWHRQHRR